MFPVSLMPQCPICGKRPVSFSSPPSCTTCFVNLHYCHFCGRVKPIDRGCWNMSCHVQEPYPTCINLFCSAEPVLPRQFPTQCISHFNYRMTWVGHDYCIQCGLLYLQEAQDLTLLCFDCWHPMARGEVFAHMSIWGLVRWIIGYCGS